MEEIKVLPFKKYSITRENAEKDYDFLNEFVMAMLPVQEMIPKENLLAMYDVIRETMASNNVISLAKDREKECIYIFEFDWDKSKPFKSGTNENGIPYLLPFK